MTSHSWLESSLHRSSKLGLEVLERARKRSVRWSNTSPPDSTSPESSGKTHQSDNEKTQDDPASLQKSLDSAFNRIVEIMDHTSYECRNFYKSVPEPSKHEREHVCHFHASRAPRPSPELPSTSGRKHIPVPMSVPLKDAGKSQCGPEDFHIVLSPGSYAITAGIQGATPQTQVVRVKPGESMSLTFNL
ncbi:hypothetical protein ACEWY4_010372 [Coilia grayii]|uniref:A-kinase interacting protein 1 n=1 Tax=Coilia grayii TaxID=363190 RepID=A0ABD1K1T0_9TELE